MEFRIKGKLDGCPLWEITKTENGYMLWHWGIGSEFDNLRLPLELLQKSIGANIWKDTLKDAVKLLGGQDADNWSKDEMIEYLMKF